MFVLLNLAFANVHLLFELLARAIHLTGEKTHDGDRRIGPRRDKAAVWSYYMKYRTKSFVDRWWFKKE